MDRYPGPRSSANDRRLPLADISSETEEQPDGRSLREVLHVVCKRKRLIATFCLCAAPIVVAASLLFGDTAYLATSQLLLTPVREHVSGTPPAESAQHEEIARISELLTGRILAEQVVRRMGARALYKQESVGPLQELLASWRAPPDPQVEFDAAVASFAKGVAVKPAGRSMIVNLSMRHEDAATAAQAVNALTDLFIERYLSIYRNPKAASFVEEQFAKVKTNLRESEASLQAFMQKHGVATSFPDEMERIDNQLVAARSALSDTRKQHAEVASQLAEVRNQLRETPANAREINITRDKLASLELEEQEMSLRMRPENPSLRTARENLRIIHEKLASMNASKTSASFGAETHAALQQEALRNSTIQKALQAREQAEIVKVKELEGRLRDLREASTEYGRLHQQLQANEQAHRSYQSKVEALRISDALDAQRIASVRVIEAAQVPLRPLPSKKRLILAAGALLSVLGGIAAAFLIEWLGGVLDTPEDVQRSLGLPVLAWVPEISVKADLRDARQAPGVV